MPLHKKEKARRILQELVDLGAEFVVDPDTMSIKVFRIAMITNEKDKVKAAKLKDELKQLIRRMPEGQKMLSLISLRLQEGMCMKAGRTLRACDNNHYIWEPVFDMDHPCRECGFPAKTVMYPSMSIEDYRKMSRCRTLSDNDVAKIMAESGIAVRP